MKELDGLLLTAAQVPLEGGDGAVGDIQRIRVAIEKLDTICGTDIVLFSLNRFSDWCVHEASWGELLHQVTVERLKY